MRFFTLLALIFTSPIWAMSESHTSQDLEITGFRLIADTNSARTYKFHDDTEYTISKNRFSTRAQAENFCGQNMKLSDDALLFAMSGAANFDSFLLESISYKFKDVSGIWWWAPTKTDLGDIVLMFDGRGSQIDMAWLKELNDMLVSEGLAAMSLPAICQKL